MFGRMYNERAGQIAATIIGVGFNVTFFTQFIMGSKGMPRRYYDYTDEFAIYHLISSLGSYLMAIGFFMVAIYLVKSLINGEKAPSNPWGSAALEWQSASPPVHLNFDGDVEVMDPYDYSEVQYDPTTGNYVRTSSEVNA
jgi:cytochrome c oxidase subunit 1